MSFEIHTDADLRFVETIYHGSVDAEEISRAIVRMPEEASFEEAAYGISDFRDATLELGMEDLKPFVALKDPRFFSKARWALLMGRARDTALGLIYERMEAQTYEVKMVNFWATWCLPCKDEIPHLQKIFSEREAALEWLGLPEATR